MSQIAKPEEGYFKVFVYGSLKRGFGNHRLLEGAEFLGEAQTKFSNFAMLSLGSFPMVFFHGELSAARQAHNLWSSALNKMIVSSRGYIEGEVYGVDKKTLSNLDRLEGHPNFYRRMDISIKNGGMEYPCQCYIGQTAEGYLTDEDCFRDLVSPDQQGGGIRWQ